MENSVVIPSKSIIYRRFIDDIFSKQKLGDNVLFDQLNNCHPNIKFTIELINPGTFLDTKLANISNNYKFDVYRKTQGYLQQLTPKHYSSFKKEIIKL